MGHLINSAFVGLFLILAYYSQKRRREKAFASQHGCDSPPSFPRKDPFFGLDFAYAIHTDLAVTVQSHKRYSRTFEVKSIRERSVWTVAPENLQAINSPAKDWGLEPLRLLAMETLCGRGFLTTDGPTWQHSRKLLKPTFSKASMIDFPTLSIAVDELLGRLPDTGVTIDLQPLLDTLVGGTLIQSSNTILTHAFQFMHTSTRFLTGLSTISDKGTLEGPFDIETFMKAFHDGLFGTGLRIILGRLSFLAPRAKWLASCGKTHEFLDYYIDQALARKEASEFEEGPLGSPANPKYRSMLEGLAEQTNDKVEIRSQIIQGMMASQETTSVLLSNTLFLLSRHTSIWDQLQDEISSLGQEELTYQSLSAFKLMRNIHFECESIFLPE